MLLLVQNRRLTKDREKTWLTASVAVGGTTLNVKAIDANAWADNDWLIVGEIGTPNAEVLQVNGAVSNGTTLTVDNAGSGGARYAHSADEPVYRIDYNQIKVYRGTTTDSSLASLLTTISLQPDDYETRYEDSTNTTGYGFARFYNSFTGALSPFSDAIPYTGQSQKSLAKMISKIRSLCDEVDEDFLTDDEIVDGINDKQRDIINERLWTFNEVEYSDSAVANQFEYDKPTLIKTLHTVRFNTQPLANISQAKWELLHYDTDQSTNDPSHACVWNNKVKVYPRPSTAATSTTLDGNITSSATSITVADASDFKRGDYYRFTIDSEIIYATTLTTNTFSGCLRAQEGTTAVAHTTGTTVTENNIIFTGQGEAVDLEAVNDETIVPEPIVICYGVSADFCIGKLNKPALGDRWDAKYTRGMDNLRDRYTLKMSSQMGRIKDPREVVKDNGVIRNPNDYPQNVTATS